MLTALEQFIVARTGGPRPGLEEVLAQFRPLRVRRQQVLVDAGAVCTQCYFVARGAVQVFVRNANGAETTRDVVLEDNFVTDVFGFINRQPATEIFRAVEPSELLAIGRDDFQRLLDTVPPFEQVYRQILEQSYANSVYRLNTFVGMDARQRVEWLLTHRPRLLTRLSNKLVASYLGISPETLSRLKRRL